MGYEGLLGLARLGVPLATVGYVAKKARKKKKRIKDIYDAGAGALIGTAFTRAVYSWWQGKRKNIGLYIELEGGIMAETKWMKHVKETKSKFPKLSLKEILKKAKNTYKKWKEE